MARDREIPSGSKVLSLVEIDHEAHLGPDCLSDGLDRREVIGETLAAKAQLQTLEPALLA
jgi:hypothetical protein